VATIQVRTRELTRTVTVTGPIEPIRTVSVNAQTAGTVLRVLVEEGSRVHSGDLMAELDARETAAQLERAKAVLANAEAAYRRAEDLQADGLATAAELDSSLSSYQLARADVELWQVRLAFSQILAPVAGAVTVKHVEQGSAVSTNQPMFELADDSLLVVRVRVSEMDVVSLGSGARVKVSLDAYPGAEISGRVRRVFPSADAASRLVPVEVALGATRPGVVARPGFLARVQFQLGQTQGVLAVPTSAVGTANGSSHVFVVESGRLARRPVSTGVTAAGWVEVKQGLSAGEAVVTSGHVSLQPGMAVRATTDSSLDAGAR
jgi:RND family efflux transporter MFP subunit